MTDYRWRIGIALAALMSVAAAAGAADARPFARACSPGFTADLRDTVAFLKTHMTTVRGLYRANNTYHSRKLAARRVARRLDRGRKLNDIWFACAKASSPLCRSDSAGRHAFGAASDKIRLCESKRRRGSTATTGFCRLVELVAHEFGHAVGIKKNAAHRRGDRVYRWGDEWFDYCRGNGHDRGLTLPGGRVR